MLQETSSSAKIRHIKNEKRVRSNLGRRDNFADEVLDSMEMVDKHEMVQQVVKSKNQLPSFVLFTENQIVDLEYLVDHQGQNNFVLGVERTFNLEPFYVTALVYKNQRIVRNFFHR